MLQSNLIRLHVLRSVVSPFMSVYNRLFGNYTATNWQKKGMPLPAPHVIKQFAINRYQQQFKLNTLVETGTYLGDMVNAQKDNFKRIISIELSNDLAQLAQQRFRNQPHIQILPGDSATVLKQVTATLTSSALFWLDGHYSGGITAKGDSECPIFGELDAIFSNNKNHIILIDDARCFVGKGDYPSLEQLSNYVKQHDSRYRISVEHDMIHVVC
jgi:hypothetical protein